MRTPTQNSNIATSSNSLQHRARYGMMSGYLNHGNGGHNVNVGIPNSRGGGSEAEKVNIYRYPANQEQAARSLQGQWNVEDHARRLATVSRCSEEHQSNNRRKLNSLVFSAATQASAIAWNPLTQTCCQSLLLAYFATWQENRQEVAGGVA